MAFLTKTSHFFHTFILFFLCLNSFIHHSFCQQNIETFYPSALEPASAPAPAVIPPSSPAVLPSPPTQPTPLLPPPPDTTGPPPSRSTSHKAIYTAVGVTAASTLVVAAALFFFCTKYTQRKKENGGQVQTVGAIAASGGGAGGGGGGGRLQPLQHTEFTRFDGNIKGLIVDEDGLDVLYWRKLEGSQRKSGPFHKDVFNKGSNGRRTYSRGKSSSSYNQIHPKEEQSARLLGPPKQLENETTFQSVGRAEEAEKVVVAKEEISRVPSLPPLPSSNSSKAGSTPPPPPPPPMAVKKGPAPPPPMAAKKGPAPPPPPLKMGGSLKPPAPPKRTPSGNIREASAIGEEVSDSKNDQVKLKPLHWEKVNVNTDHSMVWDKIERGSFQYNGDMMEALFGCVATNRKSPKGDATVQGIASPNAAAKIFILDARRSQNIAIVIRSLGITRNELIAGLQEGKGLNVDILEKLTRITPTREEKIQILAFEGDAGRLADAESFLYHLLKAVPSSFTRVSTMLFRFNYGSEVHQLKESLQTLDSACTELRNRGVFLKLLEAILKAGNRLNAGTARGDAKAFNLTALRKLSDYKSSDGKTTLLHFVVHEVVRNEGRRCVMNRNNSLSRTNSQKNSSSNLKPEESKSKEEQEKEFLQLGLPVVGGLSSEFSNVKKAATLDYDTISSISTSVGARIAETRQLVLQCGADNEGRDFIAEMKEFLAAAEGEIKVVQEEQTRVMEFVTKTAQYYQAGGFKDKQPLLLFVIVKDFLNTVDQACIDIARSLQHKKSHTSSASSSSSSTPSSPPSPDILRTRVTFPRLPRHFLSDKSSGSDTDDNS
ncbi:formin-like protein 4 [Chenopodium quinoa]|uniref:formin-like protein 4 n=1 Tax=Chenopodium quinoa TaxID=63459 RepID=UPI000B77D851|nr:formin-like protein 4 [Chenopodium quinoa]